MCTHYNYTAVSELLEGTFKDNIEATTLETRIAVFLMGWLYIPFPFIFRLYLLIFSISGIKAFA